MAAINTMLRRFPDEGCIKWRMMAFYHVRDVVCSLIEISHLAALQ
jgi:hypothetical protein